MFRPMKDYNKRTKCPDCGSKAKRLISCPTIYAEGIVRVSYALGVNPEQVKSGEVFKTHPGAEFDKDGNMIIHSRQEKLRRLKERGWVEYE